MRMNITTQPVSFLPASAAQPTDALRRDNGMREAISQVNAQEANQRERGLGQDAERKPQNKQSSVAQQFAEARVEAGFPYFLKRIEGRDEQGGSGGQQQQSSQQEQAARERVERNQAADGGEEVEGLNRFTDAWQVPQQSDGAATLTYQQADGSFDGTFSLNAAGAAVDPIFIERGQRIEQFYEGSFRPNETFLLGVA